jgi:hypothetical protein
MKGTSRYLMVVAVILSVALVSVALARGGGGRGVGRSLAAAGTLCLSGARLDRSLSTIDILIKPNSSQKAALEELKKAAKEYSENMLKVCDGDSPTDIPAKLAGADKRLDDSSSQYESTFIDWPGDPGKPTWGGMRASEEKSC